MFDYEAAFGKPAQMGLCKCCDVPTIEGYRRFFIHRVEIRVYDNAHSVLWNRTR